MIRENKDCFRARLTDPVQNILRGGVHAPAAVDDRAAAVGQQLLDALAAGHGDQAVFVLALGDLKLVRHR